MTGRSVFTPLVDPPKRLSVSAIRDFHRCGEYYRRGRVVKEPEDRVTHHRWAGSVLHAAFMLAYGTPVPPAGGERRVSWAVDNAGTIEDAMELFGYLWAGERPLDNELVGPTRAQEAFDVLIAEGDLHPPADRDFAKGKLKALKDPNPAARKDAYRAYFKEMLESSLEEGLAHPVVAMEQRVDYQLGGVPMLGFIDLVLRRPDGGLVFVDLKTGSKLPQDREIAYEDQMNSYFETAYEGQRPAEVWYHHMKSGTILNVPRNERFIEALHETAAAAYEQISEGRFVKRLSPECGMCSRRVRCMG